jgi:hypothetical protein
MAYNSTMMYKQEEYEEQKEKELPFWLKKFHAKDAKNVYIPVYRGKNKNANNN